MITLPPLPDRGALLKAVLPGQPDLAVLASPWMRDEDARGGWLSRSAWSLVLLAHWRSQAKSDVPMRVWLPDYFCDASLALLRKLPVQLHFYPVTGQLLPAWTMLREQAKAESPDILVLVHYFGMPTPASEAREFCKREGAWLVEDATHVLKPLPGVGTEGDFVMYSPHKLLPIPEGALLVARARGASKLGIEGVVRLGDPVTWPAQAESLLPAASGSRQLITWCIKRSLQKLGLGRAPGAVEFDDQSAGERFPPPAMSAFAQRLLSDSLAKLSDTALRRKRNGLLLDYLMQESAQVQLQPAWRACATPFIPYMASYKSAQAKDAYAHLRSRGLPANTWPDLPPEVRLQSQGHEMALSLRESNLFLPLHQSVRAPALLRLFGKDAVSRHLAVELHWGPCDSQEWNGLLREAGVSNLLQAWSYGEAKAAGGWRVRRLILKRDGRTLAFAQVLQKNLGALLCVSRINRGPLFLPGLSAEEEQACLSTIARELGVWQRGRVLLWAPESRLSGISLAQLPRAGFHQLSVRGWSSSTVDLDQDHSSLRAGLSGSWRNMLNVAQRNAVLVQQLDDDEAVFEFLLDSCGSMMQERGQTFPAALYRELRHQLVREGTPGLLLAVRGPTGALAAATWAVPHGLTSTYLLGWINGEGRKLHAHHLLLWETMLRLKAQGLRWFDLGGIDDVRTGGIAAFKLGIGGERYQLVGEGWCC